MARPSGSEDDGDALELVGFDGEADGALEDNALDASLVQLAANRSVPQMSATPLMMMVSFRRVMYL